MRSLVGLRECSSVQNMKRRDARRGNRRKNIASLLSEAKWKTQSPQAGQMSAHRCWQLALHHTPSICAAPKRHHPNNVRAKPQGSKQSIKYIHVPFGPHGAQGSGMCDQACSSQESWARLRQTGSARCSSGRGWSRMVRYEIE